MIRQIRYKIGGALFNYHMKMHRKTSDKMDSMEVDSFRWRILLIKCKHHSRMMKLYFMIKWPKHLRQGA